FQPVAVGDVAETFARAVERPGTAGQVFELGGPRAYTFDEVLDQVGAVLGRPRLPKLHHPVGLVAPIGRVFEALPLFPLTRDQLLMMGEHNTCDPPPWASAFGITPVEFSAGLRAYLR